MRCLLMARNMRNVEEINEWVTNKILNPESNEEPSDYAQLQNNLSETNKVSIFNLSLLAVLP